MTRAAPAALLVLLAMLFGSGCALLSRDKDGRAADGVVDTGPRQAVYRLEIDAPDDLRKLLAASLDLARFESAPASEGIDATELARLVAAAPAQARGLLETEGYFAADVKPERSTEPDGRVLVRLQVEPGPRTTVAAVSIAASGPLQQRAAADGGSPDARTLDSLRRTWPLPPGRPFRQPDWSAAKTASLSKLRSEGYPAATWESTQARIDAVAQRAELDLLVASGPLFTLGPLRIEGLQRYDESTVRRLSTFTPGEPYREKTLLDFQERLQRVGLFEGASVEIEPDPAKAEGAPVQVRVKEAPLQQATVGAGISANTGARITLEHLHRRPFGLDWIAKNQFEIGRDLKSWKGELLSHPQEGLYRNLVAANVEKLRSGDELRTSWSGRIGRTKDTQRLERLYYLEYVDARVDNPAGTTRSAALSANYQWVVRKVDSVLLPTEGYTLSLQTGAGQARSSDKADGPFARGYGRLTVYRPIGSSWYASARIEAGQVFAQEGVGVPDTLLFRAGGDDSVRGYGYRTLGPVVDGAVTSGRMLLTGSVEIARPVSPRLPSVWWAAFVDAGNATNRWTDLDPALGYGVGLRWRSPVGPLRVDLAYGQELRRLRLHLSVGIAF